MVAAIRPEAVNKFRKIFDEWEAQGFNWEKRDHIVSAFRQFMENLHFPEVYTMDGVRIELGMNLWIYSPPAFAEPAKVIDMRVGEICGDLVQCSTSSNRHWGAYSESNWGYYWDWDEDNKRCYIKVLYASEDEFNKRLTEDAEEKALKSLG